MRPSFFTQALELASVDTAAFTKCVVDFKEYLVIADYRAKTQAQYITELCKHPASKSYKVIVCALQKYMESINLAFSSRAIPRVKSDSSLPLYFDSSAIIRLLSALNNDREKLMISLLYSTGLRVGELCSIRLSDIHFHRGAQGDYGNICVRQCKGRRDRTVFFGKSIHTLYHRYIREYPCLGSGYLFQTGKETPVKPNHISKILQAAANKCGIPSIHCHSLRHSYAVSFLNQGGRHSQSTGASGA